MGTPIVNPEPKEYRDRLPSTTKFSPTDLGLDNTPFIQEVDDPKLHKDITDLYNAVEALQVQSDRNDEDVEKVTTRLLRNTTVDESYTVVATDGTVRVDASTVANLIVTLPPAADVEGLAYNIKRIDLVPLNKVDLVGDGTEEIDDRSGGIRISTKSSYTVKSNGTGWDII